MSIQVDDRFLGVDKTIGQVIHASENLPAVELEAGKTDSDE
jgi:hypothetical protein